MRSRCFVLVALLIAVPAAARVRILFVGNSLTYVNDIPSMVRTMAAADHTRVDVGSVVDPNFSIEDHLDSGRAEKTLRESRWDFVVVQQGPSAMDESRAVLVRDTVRFAELTRRAGSKLIVYMVWPAESRSFDFDGVSKSYREAANAANAAIAPAGDVWRDIWKHDASIELYGPDRFHPTPAGSYAAALTIYRAVFGHLPGGSSAREAARTLKLNVESVKLLRASAESVD